MRKVSREVATAFLAGKSKRVSNTHTDGEHLYLFGNKIASKVGDFISICDGGFSTATTKERLNALLQLMKESGEYKGVKGGIYQKNYTWFYLFEDFRFGGFFRNGMIAGMKK